MRNNQMGYLETLKSITLNLHIIGNKKAMLSE